ncbi:hypothetical protein [Sphingomonas faeni]|uniref:hypothetical protein n=1 Tax=Sphingomonas faeni TaxID=185950 RepID=UPI00334C11A0
MTTMIEKMARAICIAAGAKPDDSKSGMDPWSKVWTSYIPHARAALTAMLEPSEAMVDVGNQCLNDGSSSSVFDAMIQAALDEE